MDFVDIVNSLFAENFLQEFTNFAKKFHKKKLEICHFLNRPHYKSPV